MTKLRVFPDTGALVAMLVFPRDRHGRLTLAGEVLQLYDEGTFDLLLSRVVVDELEEVESLYGLLCVFGLRERSPV